MSGPVGCASDEIGIRALVSAYSPVSCTYGDGNQSRSTTIRPSPNAATGLGALSGASSAVVRITAPVVSNTRTRRARWS
jgi:hypothetical protein